MPPRRGARRSSQHVPTGAGTIALDDLLAVETLDFVDICTPPGSHAALIEQALDARLHVLCEKPLVTRAVDAGRCGGGGQRRSYRAYRSQLARSADLPQDLGADRRRRHRRRAIAPLAHIAHPPRGRAPLRRGTGASIRQWRAAASCSTTAGTRFIASMRWAGARPRRIAASLETRRFHDWPLEDTATLTLDLAASASPISISPGPPTSARNISRSKASGAASMLSATASSSKARRASAAGPVRRPCPKDRTIRTGSPG